MDKIYVKMLILLILSQTSCHHPSNKNQEKMKSPYKIEMVSHHLCPHLQKCVITMEAKGLRRNIDYKVTYMDITNVPSSFQKISPDGKMPIAIIDDKIILDNSDIINEFLDEMTPGSLLPNDPLQRAIHRSSVADSHHIFQLLRIVFTAKDEITLLDAKEELFGRLGKLEILLENSSSYFGNDEFSIVDATYGAFFTLMFAHESLKEDSEWNSLPKVRHWAMHLNSLEAVVNSKPDDYDVWFDKFFDQFGSYFRTYNTTTFQSRSN